MIALVAAVLLAQAAPAPSTDPPPTIAHTTTSSTCTLFRNNVMQSVGRLLRNDAIIEQAGTTVDGLVVRFNAGESDSPYHNPAVQLAQIRLAQLGTRLVQNAAAIDTLLSDARFARASNSELNTVRETLQSVSERQHRLTNIIFSIAVSGHPSDLKYYPPSTQDDLVDALRNEPGNKVIPGDQVFGPLYALATENIAQTHHLEDAAATKIVPLASLCK